MRFHRSVGPAATVILAALAWSPPLEAQSWRTVTKSRQIGGEERLDARIKYGAGTLRVRAGDPGVLYHLQLRYDEESFEPVAEYDAGRLTVGVEGRRRNIHIGEDRSGGEMTLLLARGIPTDLDLEFGASRADIDLGGLSLTDLDLETGASEVRLDVSRPNPVSMRRASLEVGAAEFTARRLGNLDAEHIEVSAGVGEVVLELTGAWRRDAYVQVDMGLGSLELRVPRGLGVKLEKSSFLTSLDSEGLIKRGDAWYSPDWEEAERRISIDVEAAFGSVRVVWVR